MRLIERFAQFVHVELQMRTRAAQSGIVEQFAELFRLKTGEASKILLYPNGVK